MNTTLCVELNSKHVTDSMEAICTYCRSPGPLIKVKQLQFSWLSTHLSYCTGRLQSCEAPTLQLETNFSYTIQIGDRRQLPVHRACVCVDPVAALVRRRSRAGHLAGAAARQQAPGRTRSSSNDIGAKAGRERACHRGAPCRGQVDRQARSSLARNLHVRAACGRKAALTAQGAFAPAQKHNMFC